jgi:1-acyl-sn-glycerol-3-phosphate acyltransferase
MTSVTREAKPVYKMTATALDLVGRLPFSRVSATGQENLSSSDAQILAFTHHNSWDIPALGVAVYRHNRRPVHFLTKEELLGAAVVGAFFKHNYGLPISRDNPTREQLHAAIDVLADGAILGVAPEGGRVRTREVLEMRGGVGLFATRASVEVVPVGIAGRDIKRPFGPFMPRTMHVHFGEPIFPSGTSRNDRKELDEKLRLALIDALDTAHDLHPHDLN